MRILRPCPHVIGFYDGRNDTPRRYAGDNWYDDGALRLGICSYAIVEGADAIVYDTHASVDHARAIRRALDHEGVTRITVVLSHWHADHIAGNAVFADCEIVACAATRDALAAHREDLENGTPPIDALVMPTTIFEDRCRMRVGSLEVELRQLDIHSADGTVVMLPGGVLLAGDTLEDPITYVVEPERLPIHLADLRRLRTWPLGRILPNHGSAGDHRRRRLRHPAHRRHDPLRGTALVDEDGRRGCVRGSVAVPRGGLRQGRDHLSSRLRRHPSTQHEPRPGTRRGKRRPERSPTTGRRERRSGPSVAAAAVRMARRLRRHQGPETARWPMTPPTPPTMASRL